MIHIVILCIQLSRAIQSGSNEFDIILLELVTSLLTITSFRMIQLSCANIFYYSQLCSAS